MKDNKDTKEPIDQNLEQPEQPTVEEEVQVTEEAVAEPIDNSAELALAELTNDLQRTRADFENYRKQVESQKSQAMAAARMATVSKFLPLVDDFERAMTTYPEQLAPLQKSLDKTLKGLGLAKINSEPGTEFNPDFHEAISVEDSDGETEVVSETLRPGYLYEGDVLRTAMVKVSRQ